jgi:hypothetical protein
MQRFFKIFLLKFLDRLKILHGFGKSFKEERRKYQSRFRASHSLKLIDRDEGRGPFLEPNLHFRAIFCFRQHSSFMSVYEMRVINKPISSNYKTKLVIIYFSRISDYAEENYLISYQKKRGFQKRRHLILSNKFY